MEAEIGKTPLNLETHESQAADDRQFQKGRLFRMLSILWIFPSFGAGWILVGDLGNWFRAGSLTALLSMVKIEEWAALLLLLAHVIFISLAIRFRKRG